LVVAAVLSMKASRIESRLLFPQSLTGRDDVLPILLGGADAPFLDGSLRWRRKRKIADWFTFTFFFAKRALSSASVLSGCSATSAPLPDPYAVSGKMCCARQIWLD
jgi:hypothetical protein